MFHFYNTFHSFFHVLSLFSSGVTISSTPALGSKFFEAFFTAFNPVYNNCFLYFHVSDKNP